MPSDRFVGQIADADLLPFLCRRLAEPGNLFVGPHPVQTLHEDVAEDGGVTIAHSHIRCDLEARIALQTDQVGGNNRNLLHAGLLQRAPDKCDIVGRAAAAAGLAHDDLVGGDGIQTAAEGVELDQIQVIPGLDKVGGGIEPGVVHPLVVDAQRPLNRRKV